MRSDTLLLDAVRRSIVHRTIVEVCDYRQWDLRSLNVRTNHVHVVVGAPQRPERVLTTLKSWCTRRMIEAGVIGRGVKVWTRHGSTRYLWNEEQRETACLYVLEGQGPDLARDEP